MVNSQKNSKMNGNGLDRKFLPLEEVNLFYLLIYDLTQRNSFWENKSVTDVPI